MIPRVTRRKSLIKNDIVLYLSVFYTYTRVQKKSVSVTKIATKNHSNTLQVSPRMII